MRTSIIFAQGNSISFNVIKTKKGFECTSDPITKIVKGTISDSDYEYHMSSMTINANDNDGGLLAFVGVSWNYANDTFSNLLHLTGDDDQVIREGRILFANGQSIMLKLIILDETDIELANFYYIQSFSIGFAINRTDRELTKFRQSDIKTITIGNYSLSMSTLEVNTSRMLDQMCKELINSGCTAASGRSGTNNGVSSHGSATSSLRDVKPIDLIRYPLGVLNGNLKNQNIDYIVQTSKQMLKAEVTKMELDTFYSLEVGESQGYNLYLYNKAITYASIYIFKNQKLRWDYNIRFKRAQYSSEDVIDYANRFINDIKSNGFKLYPNSTSKNFPLMQLMSKGTLFVEVQVQDDSQFDDIMVNMRVQPDGNDY